MKKMMCEVVGALLLTRYLIGCLQLDILSGDRLMSLCYISSSGPEGLVGRIVPASAVVDGLYAVDSRILPRVLAIPVVMANSIPITHARTHTQLGTRGSIARIRTKVSF